MEIIKIYQGNLVNARELHHYVVVQARGGQRRGEDFSNWIKRMLDYQFTINVDYSTIGFNYKGEVIEENGVAKFSESDNQRVSKRDYYLTLECAKQIAMLQNNDKGREVREYFIECEKALKELNQNKRLEAFVKLEGTKEKLLENITEIGGSHADYVQIDLAGRQVLFNGEPLPDEALPTLLLKGRDFATEMTNTRMMKNKHSLQDVEELNKIHHKDIRKTIIDNIGDTPENFPAEGDIKELGKKN